MLYSCKITFLFLLTTPMLAVREQDKHAGESFKHNSALKEHGNSTDRSSVTVHAHDHAASHITLNTTDEDFVISNTTPTVGHGNQIQPPVDSSSLAPVRGVSAQRDLLPHPVNDMSNLSAVSLVDQIRSWKDRPPFGKGRGGGEFDPENCDNLPPNPSLGCRPVFNCAELCGLTPSGEKYKFRGQDVTPIDISGLLVYPRNRYNTDADKKKPETLNDPNVPATWTKIEGECSAQPVDKCQGYYMKAGRKGTDPPLVDRYFYIKACWIVMSGNRSKTCDASWSDMNGHTGFSTQQCDDKIEGCKSSQWGR